MDWEAQDEGVLAKILAPDGTKDIAVGTPVAVIVDDAADVRPSSPNDHSFTTVVACVHGMSMYLTSLDGPTQSMVWTISVQPSSTPYKLNGMPCTVHCRGHAHDMLPKEFRMRSLK